MKYSIEEIDNMRDAICAYEGYIPLTFCPPGQDCIYSDIPKGVYKLVEEKLRTYMLCGVPAEEVISTYVNRLILLKKRDLCEYKKDKEEYENSKRSP